MIDHFEAGLKALLQAESELEAELDSDISPPEEARKRERSQAQALIAAAHFAADQAESLRTIVDQGPGVSR